MKTFEQWVEEYLFGFQLKVETVTITAKKRRLTGTWFAVHS
jgi:hypothetical protein